MENIPGGPAKFSHDVRLAAALFAFAILILLSGCVSVKDTVVLVPDQDGTTGRVTVTTKGGFRTLSTPYTMVEVYDAGRQPAEPQQIERKRIEELFAGSIRALPAQPSTFLLYFKHDSRELLDESKTVIPEILAAVRAREFYEMSIIGHTDTTGSEEHNMRLSTARAAAVRDTLVSAGVRADRIELRYHGKADPIVPTGDNVSEPRNRVVEVVVK